MEYDDQMAAFAKLAEISQVKGQAIPRDKFLLLCGIAACRSGRPDVAARCREMVLAHNSAHLIGHFDTFADALRSEDFQTLAEKLVRFCTFEKAEHLLSGLGAAWQPGEEENPGAFVLELLRLPSFPS